MAFGIVNKPTPTLEVLSIWESLLTKLSGLSPNFSNSLEIKNLALPWFDPIQVKKNDDFWINTFKSSNLFE